MGEVIALHWPEDGPEVLDLCKRADDYIHLETGSDPDMGYVQDTMTDAPASVPAHQIWCWGHRNQDGALDGFATCLKGFYHANDWYLGLLLIAQASRSHGLGARLAQHIIAQAKADSADCLRVAVLDTNPRARAFWQRLGFAHEKSTSDGDGQMRHVHRLRFA